ncbi:MAG: hypothetical protein HOP19_27505 [Acidobacteria bacterium]|nr:hypothetical protein [Acidobacteriota bacterium]
MQNQTTKKTQAQKKTQNKTPKKMMDSQKLMLEDLDRWRGESPAAGQVTQATEEKLVAQKTEAVVKQTPAQPKQPTGANATAMRDQSSQNLQTERNSAHQETPDVTAQNWSAEALAEQNVYEDETTVKARMKTGKKVRAAHSS